MYDCDKCDDSFTFKGSSTNTRNKNITVSSVMVVSFSKVIYYSHEIQTFSPMDLTMAHTMTLISTMTTIVYCTVCLQSLYISIHFCPWLIYWMEVTQNVSLDHFCWPWLTLNWPCWPWTDFAEVCWSCCPGAYLAKLWLTLLTLNWPCWPWTEFLALYWMNGRSCIIF